MWRYVLLLVWPRQLSNDYSSTQIPLAQGTVLDWIGCLLLVGGALAALWQARRNRPVLFFALFSSRHLPAGVEPALRHRHHSSASG